MNKEKILEGFENYKEIHDYLESNFESFLSTICEELVNYYGEEYKDIIAYRLYNTNFIFYTNEFIPLHETFADIFNKDNLSEDYAIIKKQHKYISEYLKATQKNVHESEVFKIVKRKIFDTSKTSYSDIDKIKREKTLEYIIKLKETCFFPLYLNDSKKVEHFIVAPLFKANDSNLIHEMIHAIMTQDLLLINGEDIYSKTGLSTQKSVEELLEECMTEIEAKRISKRIKEKEINFIDKFYPHKVSQCFYDKYIPFIEDFYNSFKDILIHSRITLNKSYLLEQIDRENYYYFMVALAKCYNEYFEKCDSYYYKSIFDKEIDKMKNSYSVLKLK